MPISPKKNNKQEGHSGPKSLTWVAWWPSNLVFEPTWSSFKLDLDIMMINILTKCHDIWHKTVHSRVYTKFF